VATAGTHALGGRGGGAEPMVPSQVPLILAGEKEGKNKNLKDLRRFAGAGT